MNFFIPGGAGYIGVHISSMLLENGHDVVILDNFSNSSSQAIDSLENLSGKKITFYKGSTQYSSTVCSILKVGILIIGICCICQTGSKSQL